MTERRVTWREAHSASSSLLRPMCPYIFVGLISISTTLNTKSYVNFSPLLGIFLNSLCASSRSPTLLRPLTVLRFSWKFFTRSSGSRRQCWRLFMLLLLSRSLLMDRVDTAMRISELDEASSTISSLRTQASRTIRSNYFRTSRGR